MRLNNTVIGRSSMLCVVVLAALHALVGCAGAPTPFPQQADLSTAVTPPSPADQGSLEAGVVASGSGGIAGSVVGATPAPDAPAVEELTTSPDVWWRCAGIDHESLRETLVRAGLREPTGFRLFVVEVTFDKDRKRIVRERAFDWGGESSLNHGWNVASSIKIYAATSVLQRMRLWGFTPNTKVLVAARTPEEWTVRQLIELALIESDNMAYNRLVQLAGYDWLNDEFFSADNGFANSAIEKAYEQGRWQDMGEHIELRHAPEFTLIEGEHTLVVPATSGTSPSRCGGSACTNLRDLTEAMRRVILHDVLPPSQQLGLQSDDMELLRDALGAPRKRGEGVAEQIRLAFPDADITVFHKPGFSNGWFSEVVFIEDVFRRYAWVLSITAKGGREGLNDAAFLLGEVLAYGELRKIKASPEPESPKHIGKFCGDATPTP